MASISREPNGHRSIQFKAPDGKRKTIRLGKMNQKAAAFIKTKVEMLIAAAASKTPLDQETARWVGEVGVGLAAKLAAVGLIRPPESSTLGKFADSFLAGRSDLKASSRVAYGTHRDRIVAFFGPDKSLRDITAGDADSFAVHLRESLSPATVGRTIKVAKQFFRAAHRLKLIAENPFADARGLWASRLMNPGKCSLTGK